MILTSFCFSYLIHYETKLAPCVGLELVDFIIPMIECIYGVWLFKEDHDRVESRGKLFYVDSQFKYLGHNGQDMTKLGCQPQLYNEDGMWEHPFSA